MPGLAATQAKETTHTTGQEMAKAGAAGPTPSQAAIVDGDDLTIRRRPSAALGPQSGASVVVTPATGRVPPWSTRGWSRRPVLRPAHNIKLVAGLPR